MRPIVLSGHSRPLTRVKYNLHGDILFSSSKDSSAVAWRSHNGERLGKYISEGAAVADVDPNYDTTTLLMASFDSSMRLWDVETGKCIAHYRADKAPFRFSRFAQGCKMAFYVTDALMGAQNAAIIIFDVEQLKKDVDNCTISEIVLEGKPRVTSCTWGYLNKTIITGHANGSICMWDTKTGEPLKERRVFDSIVTDIQMDTMYGYMIASSKDQTAKIIDANTLEVKKGFTIDRPVNSVSISPIRPHVILGGGQEAVDVTTTRNQGNFKVRFFHLVYEEELGSIEGHFGPVNSLQFSPDGRSFSSGGEDGYIRINHFDSDYFDFKYCGEY